jgi:hypothetical protein
MLSLAEEVEPVLEVAPGGQAGGRGPGHGHGGHGDRGGDRPGVMAGNRSCNEMKMLRNVRMNCYAE